METFNSVPNAELYS